MCIFMTILMCLVLSVTSTDYEQSKPFIPYSFENPHPEINVYESNELIAGHPEMVAEFMNVYPVFVKALPDIVGEELATAYYIYRFCLSLRTVILNDIVLRRNGLDRVYTIEMSFTF